MISPHAAILWQGVEPHFSFPHGAALTEQMALRWIHLVAGIIWIGLLYFFNLVGFPTMKQLDASVRGKVYLVMMARAMTWFRWSALITVVVGLRYFAIFSRLMHSMREILRSWGGGLDGGCWCGSWPTR